MLGTHIGFEQGMTFRGNLSLVFKVIATPFHTYYQRGGIKSGTRNGLSVICGTSLTGFFGRKNSIPVKTTNSAL